jgi:flagellar motor switch protein FliM
MSSQLFSDQDLQALLGTHAAAGGKTAVQPQGVKLYDFRRPNRVSKDKLRALEAMYERLAKSLEGWLIAKVRDQVEVSLESVEQVSFGEFMTALPSPCASYIYDISESGGQQGVIDVGMELAFYLVDRFFGGYGGAVELDRALSSIERKANRLLAERLAGLVAETWHDHVAMKATITGFESVPEILQVTSREDPVLTALLLVRAGPVSGTIRLCVPFTALEKFFSSQGSRRIKNPPASAQEIESARQLNEVLLRETHVPLSARLAEFNLSMREVSGLEAGSIISTGIRVDAELEVWVAGEPRLRAFPGRAPGSKALALQILNPLNRPDVRPDTTNPEE